MTSHCQLQAFVHGSATDMPDDHPQDPDDTADFKLPDQQVLIDAFTAGLCKESQHDYQSLSTLLAALPDLSLSYGHVKDSESGMSQNGKWHIPECKVAYLRMESGIYQNGMWQCGICQKGKWHILECKIAYTRVAYPKFICEIYLCVSCMIFIA